MGSAGERAAQRAAGKTKEGELFGEKCVFKTMGGTMRADLLRKQAENERDKTGNEDADSLVRVAALQEFAPRMFLECVFEPDGTTPMFTEKTAKTTAGGDMSMVMEACTTVLSVSGLTVEAEQEAKKD